MDLAVEVIYAGPEVFSLPPRLNMAQWRFYEWDPRLFVPPTRLFIPDSRFYLIKNLDCGRENLDCPTQNLIKTAESSNYRTLLAAKP